MKIYKIYIYEKKMYENKTYHRNEFINENIFGLSHPMNSIKALPLRGRIPGRIHQQEMVGRCQVQANASSFQGQQHDCGRVGASCVEYFYGLLPV